MNDEYKELQNAQGEEISPDLKVTIEFIEQVMGMLDAGITEYQITQEQDNEYDINFLCLESAIMIGKKGAVLTSIQMIVNSFINKQGFDYRVSLDIGGYRKKQAKILREEVYRVAQKVNKTHSASLMAGPYSPLERKQIHLYVQSIPGLTSYSEGEGFLKSVWINKA